MDQSRTSPTLNKRTIEEDLAKLEHSTFMLEFPELTMISAQHETRFQDYHPIVSTVHPDGTRNSRRTARTPSHTATTATRTYNQATNQPKTNKLHLTTISDLLLDQGFFLLLPPEEVLSHYHLSGVTSGYSLHCLANRDPAAKMQQPEPQQEPQFPSILEAIHQHEQKVGRRITPEEMKLLEREQERREEMQQQQQQRREEMQQQ
ncbi:hypothetical protein IV203_009754 [Nitzschia inconspicua]|uniref:Uncharacterized protein n=1 Tax=Nitzschia inconspicua TaxID=303405 RepID=A0A9K3KVZ8_9STRA|nr:hypothetical protein IV203_009754 [Nitzschia inconspicua]